MPEQTFTPDVWGPHYWFFLHTIAHSYPQSPSKTMKKKYYNLYQDFPLFIPSVAVGNQFAKMVDKYPVSPYLSSRTQLVRWTNFIHNKVNALLEKEQLSNASATESYWENYAVTAPIPKSNMSFYLLTAVILIGGLGMSMRSK